MINLKNYPAFRAESMGLRDDLATMISAMDEVCDSDVLSDTVKATALTSLMGEYL